MSKLSILLFLAVLPIIMILTYVYGKDKHKEPTGLLLKFFVLGIVSCFVVYFISQSLETVIPFMQKNVKEMEFIEVALYAFFCVGLIEELCKWVMVYFFGYNNKEFDEVYDIMVYSIFVSLGFAFFENILYVLFSGHITTAIVRALSAVPGHACDAIFMGYYLSVAKQYHYRDKKEQEKKNILKSIFIPTILHGIYDFCLMSGMDMFIGVFIVFVIFLYTISIKKLVKLADKPQKFKKQAIQCYKCGGIVNNQEFCPTCGAKQLNQ